jgi:hypothetical protein
MGLGVWFALLGIPRWFGIVPLLIAFVAVEIFIFVCGDRIVVAEHRLDGSHAAPNDA